jgi:transmembrane sensor
MSTDTANNDLIEETAARWVMRLDRGALTVAEQTEFDGWLAAAPRHRGAFIGAQAHWLDFDRVTALAAGGPAQAPDRRMRYLRAAAVAAVFCAGALAVLGAAQHFFGGRETTGLGEIRRLTLEDGSTVALNTHSVVQVKFDRHERRIVLRRGEASFRVAQDRNRPFLVEARDVSIRALGTAFVTRLRPRSVAVTVTEGVVEVVRNPESTATRAAPRAQRVGRNQAVVAESSRPIAAQTLSASEVARRLAWQEGWLMFEGESLEQAVIEVNRYSSTPVVLDAPWLAEKSFVGVFRTGDTRAFAHAAAAAYGVRVVERAGALHLTE